MYQQRFLPLPALLSMSLSLSLLPLIGCAGQEESRYRTVSVTEAAKMIEADPSIVVLDVRTEEEYQSETGHIADALLIPVQELEERVDELEPFTSRPVLVYCRSGNRSRTASDLLTAQGFNVTMMEGGITAWNEAGLPVEQGEGR